MSKVAPHDARITLRTARDRGASLETLDPDAAEAAYRRALEPAPDHGDALLNDPTQAGAHFNAARLHEHVGDTQMALRHFSAYKRLQRPGEGAA